MTKSTLSPTGSLLSKVSIGNYRLIRKLGEGFSGSVFEARHKKTGCKAAVKVLSRKLLSQNPKIANLLKDEFRVLSSLDHRFVVKAVDFAESAMFRDRNTQTSFAAPFLAIEKATQGEFCEMIVETGKLGEESARFYFRQLVETLAFLHSQGLAHRDIKPENMLLDKHFNLKLIDFAFANPISSEPLQLVGTEGYLPPEVFLTKQLNLRKADIFAAGVVLFVMLKGIPPFNSSRKEDPYYQLLATDPKVFWEWQNKVNPIPEVTHPLKQLLEGMLHPNPSLRWGLAEITKNAWFLTPLDERYVRSEMKLKSELLNNIKARKNTGNYI